MCQLTTVLFVSCANTSISCTPHVVAVWTFLCMTVVWNVIQILSCHSPHKYLFCCPCGFYARGGKSVQLGPCLLLIPCNERREIWQHVSIFKPIMVLRRSYFFVAALGFIFFVTTWFMHGLWSFCSWVRILLWFFVFLVNWF